MKRTGKSTSATTPEDQQPMTTGSAHAHAPLQLASETRSYWQNASRVLQCIVGIYTFHMLNSYLQEKLAQQPYGDQREYFKFPLALVFIQCLLNTCFGFCKSLIFPSKSSHPVHVKGSDDKHTVAPRKTAWYMYAAVSFTYVVAMFMTNTSLQYVSFPTQVLAKSSKMIPVMLMGVLIAHKRYPLRRYLIVLVVTAGISLFMLAAPHKKERLASGVTDGSASILGISLIGASLVMDGFTAALQDSILAHSAPSSDELMINMNSWASLFIGVAALGFGEVQPAFEFCARHTSILFDMTLYCLSSALGQVFIFFCISDFGPLVCSIITTTRKFFSILFSVFWYSHQMAPLQWLSVFMVFAGLLWDIYVGYIEQQEKARLKAQSKDKVESVKQ